MKKPLLIRKRQNGSTASAKENDVRKAFAIADLIGGKKKQATDPIESKRAEILFAVSSIQRPAELDTIAALVRHIASEPVHGQGFLKECIDIRVNMGICLDKIDTEIAQAPYEEEG